MEHVIEKRMAIGVRQLVFLPPLFPANGLQPCSNVWVPTGGDEMRSGFTVKLTHDGPATRRRFSLNLGNADKTEVFSESGPLLDGMPSVHGCAFRAGDFC